eukprot:m.33738 g.33738  ORF g.33738 m.33738 type:complete len:464 (-) comp5137_c0_seq2:34-1425(-)
MFTFLSLRLICTAATVGSASSVCVMAFTQFMQVIPSTISSTFGSHAVRQVGDAQSIASLHAQPSQLHTQPSIGLSVILTVTFEHEHSDARRTADSPHSHGPASLACTMETKRGGKELKVRTQENGGENDVLSNESYFGVLIGEEAHEAGGSSYFHLCNHMPNALRRQAFTATLFMRADEEVKMRLMTAFCPIGKECPPGIELFDGWRGSRIRGNFIRIYIKYSLHCKFISSCLAAFALVFAWEVLRLKRNNVEYFINTVVIGCQRRDSQGTRFGCAIRGCNNRPNCIADFVFEVMANGSMDIMMQMTFYNDYEVTVLFQTWNVTTVGVYAFACIATFVVAFLWEAMRHKTARIEAVIDRLAAPRGAIDEDGMEYALQEEVSQAPTSVTSSTLIVRSLRTVVHTVHFAVSYFLMLIAMTYNVGLFLCIIFGCGAGYFVFSEVPDRKTTLIRAARSSASVSPSCH